MSKMEETSVRGRSHRAILFYSQRREWGQFSNFYPCKKLDLRGQHWPTTEHFFQAMKFEGTHHVDEIRKAESAGQAAKMGRSRQRPLRKDWEKVKLGVMLECVRAKFTQNPELKKLLLSTGEAKLVEHTRNDRYWGDGGDGTGKNKLGITLMQVRKELVEASAEADA